MKPSGRGSRSNENSASSRLSSKGTCQSSCPGSGSTGVVRRFRPGIGLHAEEAQRLQLPLVAGAAVHHPLQHPERGTAVVVVEQLHAPAQRLRQLRVEGLHRLALGLLEQQLLEALERLGEAEALRLGLLHAQRELLHLAGPGGGDADVARVELGVLQVRLEERELVATHVQAGGHGGHRHPPRGPALHERRDTGGDVQAVGGLFGHGRARADGCCSHDSRPRPVSSSRGPASGDSRAGARPGAGRRAGGPWPSLGMALGGVQRPRHLRPWLEVFRRATGRMGAGRSVGRQQPVRLLAARTPWRGVPRYPDVHMAGALRAPYRLPVDSTTNPGARKLDWLAGGGEMAALIASLDWSHSPLGPIETWPQSLRTTVSLCLASNFPINIIWGDGHNQIYNEGYRVTSVARCIRGRWARTIASPGRLPGRPSESRSSARSRERRRTSRTSGCSSSAMATRRRRSSPSR